MGDLIIGIGGTGGKVVRALRSRIRQTRGLEKDTNQYLCLDTMGYGYYLMEIYNKISVREAAVEDISEDLQPDKLNTLIKDMLDTEPLALERSEYLQFRGLDTETLNRLLKDPLDKNGIYYWLRCLDLRNTFTVSEKVFQFKEGAGQYRQIGRVGAFTTGDEIIRRFRAIKKRTSSLENEKRTVHIICSLAGGTGSGNFLDVGVMARSVFGISTRNEGAANINLILLLDGAFGGDRELRSRTEDMTTTTYAALRELSRLQSSPIQEVPLQFKYENVDAIVLKDMTIFQQVILMDFEGSRMNEDVRQRTVYPTMAEMVDLLTAPGTGPLVNIKLINMNKKIRSAQARSQQVGEEGGISEKTATAWAQDRFSRWMMPVTGKMKHNLGYQAAFYPDQHVEKQHTDFGFIQNGFSLLVPLKQDSDDELSFSVNTRHKNFNTRALFPGELWDISFGPTYRHLFAGGLLGGANVSIGSASDEPFHSEEETVVRATGFFRLKSGERNAWLFFLTYSNNREFLNGVPFPGIAYWYEPSGRLLTVVGIPFISVRARPLDDLTLSFSYFPVRSVSARASYRLFGGLRAYLEFNWRNEQHYLVDRLVDDYRLFYYEKQLSAGLRFAPHRLVAINLSGGYAFDRFYFEGEDYDDRYQDRIDIEDGPFGAFRVDVRF